MENKFERIGEIITTIMVIFFFIWIGGFFVGAGKLDWWPALLIIAEVVYALIFLIGSLVVNAPRDSKTHFVS